MTKKQRKGVVCFDCGDALKKMSDKDYGRMMRMFLRLAKEGCFRGMDAGLDRLFDCFLEIESILCEVEK